jgi:hypothetical protein
MDKTVTRDVDKTVTRDITRDMDKTTVRVRDITMDKDTDMDMVQVLTVAIITQDMDIITPPSPGSTDTMATSLPLDTKLNTVMDLVMAMAIITPFPPLLGQDIGWKISPHSSEVTTDSILGLKFTTNSTTP